MGDVIRKAAAVGDILADLETTIRTARARGGAFATEAEARLAPMIALIDPIRAQLAAATESFAQLEVALDVADHDADLAVADVADRVWNAIGRPARDPAYDVLFPGGSAHYVRGDVAIQPARMQMLVSLLRGGVHPKLPKALADELARSIEEQATRLQAAVDAARAPGIQVEMHRHTLDALARTAAIELAAYKRVLKAHGHSEAEIHSVIPHRPVGTKAKAPAPPVAG